MQSDRMAKTKLVTNKQSCWRQIGVWGAVLPRCEHLAEVIHCRNCAVFIEAGRSVFERRVPANYRSHWSTRLLKEDIREAKGARSAFVFRVANEWFSLPANAVDTIAEHKSIHRLPHVNNKLIAGLANISGELLVCYSLDAILGLRKHDKDGTKTQTKSFRRFMVTKAGGCRYVFSVDEVRGMSRYDPATLKQPPATISDTSRKYIVGTFELDSQEITAIDWPALALRLGGDSP